MILIEIFLAFLWVFFEKKNKIVKSQQSVLDFRHLMGFFGDHKSVGDLA